MKKKPFSSSSSSFSLTFLSQQMNHVQIGNWDFLFFSIILILDQSLTQNFLLSWFFYSPTNFTPHYYSKRTPRKYSQNLRKSSYSIKYTQCTTHSIPIQSCLWNEQWLTTRTWRRQWLFIWQVPSIDSQSTFTR